MVSIDARRLASAALGLGMYGVIGSLLLLIGIGTTFNQAPLYYGLSFGVALTLFSVGWLLQRYHTDKTYSGILTQTGFLYGMLVIIDGLLFMLPYSAERGESFSLELFLVYGFVTIAGVLFSYHLKQAVVAHTERVELEETV